LRDERFVVSVSIVTVLILFVKRIQIFFAANFGQSPMLYWKTQRKLDV